MTSTPLSPTPRSSSRLVIWCARHPLATAVIAGALLRAVAAAYGFGPFAADDYTYVIAPAVRWLGEPGAPYLALNRSELFPRIFWSFLRVGQALGASDPRTLLRVGYALVGAWTLLAIPGVYYAALPRLGVRAALCAAWLVAAQALMPRICTRALIEVASMVPLVWSLAVLELAAGKPYRARLLAGLGSGLLVGVAAMLRFQVGVVAVALFALLLYRALAGAAEERRPAGGALVGFMLGGLVAALAQGLLDVLTGQPFLDTVFRYLFFNIGHSSKFGTSPWYNYLLHLLAYTVPPVTIVLARPMLRALRAHPLAAATLGLFLLVHTLVPHKEDRFMFPILPLWFIFLGAGLAALAEGGRWQRRGLILFLVVNGLGAGVAVFSDAQRSITVPLAEVAAGGGGRLAVVGMRQVPQIYLGPGASVTVHRTAAALTDAVTGGGALPDWVLARPVLGATEIEALAAAGLRCTARHAFVGDPVDRLLVLLNPGHSQRRAPTTLLDCRSSNGPAPAH